MINVMIVEDEFIARQDLKSLIEWEKHGFNIVAEATNGKEGINLFKRYYPDIVITDVKMPVMGGLEMANEIIKCDKNVKFILLTAYDDFGYAREAIKLGINSYILKHEMDSQALISELNKIKELIFENMDYKRFTINGILKKLLQEQLYPLEIQSLINMYRLPIKRGSTIMLAVAIDQPFSNKDELDEDIIRSVNQKFIDTMNEVINQETSGIIFNVDENRYLVFATMSGFCCKERMKEIIYELCANMKVHAEESINRTISIAISDPLEDLSEIHRNYQNEFRDAKNILCMLFTGILVEHKDMGLFKEAFSSIVEILHGSIAWEGTELQDKYRKINIMYEEAGRLDNIYQVYTWIGGIVDTLERLKTPRYSRNVHEAIKHIRKNYNKDITLEELAEVMGVSVIYASQLFKKEVGESFKTYLTGYRMQKAKELLESGKYKIYEVSEMVGYQTVQYFCQTFKRLTGKNPGEYSI